MIGVQYKTLGRDRHGIDCLGLLLWVYEMRDDQIDACRKAMHTDGSYYRARDWNRDTAAEGYRVSSRMLDAGLRNHLQETTLEQAQPGDALTFSFKSRSDEPDHAGIYVGRGQVVHADMRRGVEEVPLEGALYRRLIGVFTPEC